MNNLEINPDTGPYVLMLRIDDENGREYAFYDTFEAANAAMILLVDTNIQNGFFDTEGWILDGEGTEVAGRG